MKAALPPSQADVHKVMCAPWRPITYSSHHDTKLTIKQVQVHNKVGQILNCWQ